METNCSGYKEVMSSVVWMLQMNSSQVLVEIDPTSLELAAMGVKLVHLSVTFFLKIKRTGYIWFFDKKN